jgi:hypothetical protein
MRTTASTLKIILAVILAAALASVVFVLLAYGMGWLLSLVLPLSTFEASLLSLIAMMGLLVSGVGLVRSIAAITQREPMGYEEPSDWDPDEDLIWDEDLDHEIDDILSRKSRTASSDRRNRSGPDDPCPCGSGRRYRDCHGQELGES